MTYRFAITDDSWLLAEMNQQLIHDEGHRLRKTTPELKRRMEEWLKGAYTAVFFDQSGSVVGYALYRTEPDQIYLRQLFILPDQRRKGLGREAIRLLREEIWPRGKRLTVEVLVANVAAWRFWRSVGYQDYSVTLEIAPENPKV